MCKVFTVMCRFSHALDRNSLTSARPTICCLEIAEPFLAPPETYASKRTKPTVVGDGRFLRSEGQWGSPWPLMAEETDSGSAYSLAWWEWGILGWRALQCCWQCLCITHSTRITHILTGFVSWEEEKGRDQALITSSNYPHSRVGSFLLVMIS